MHRLAAQHLAPAVDFDGSNDYISRGADLTGNADGKVGLLSAWFRLDGGDGAQIIAFRNADGFLQMDRTSANLLRITGSNAAAANILTMISTGTYTAGATWHHVLASWDLANTTGHLWIDGANAIDTATDVFTNDTIDYTRSDFFIGASSVPDRYFNGCFADFYLNLAQYLDISVEANRSRFRTPGGKPVNLGPTGAQGTGTRPIIYLRGPAASFNTNLGTGGNFTVSGGGLADASSHPH